MIIALRARNPMTKVLVSVLLFEALCAGLAIPVMINIDGVAAPLAGVAGGGVALLGLVAGVVLRWPSPGFVLGWLTQLAVIGLGLLTPGMFVVAGIFVVLWVIGFVLGKRLQEPTTA